MFAKRVASGRETYGGMPKDPPHAAIAMGRLAYRVREHDSCIHGQKWPFFTFRLKIRYILRRSAPPSRATYHQRAAMCAATPGVVHARVTQIVTFGRYGLPACP